MELAGGGVATEDEVVRIGEDSTVAAKDHATGALGAGEHSLYRFNNFLSATGWDLCHPLGVFFYFVL
jgi:hypothetical protein